MNEKLEQLKKRCEELENELKSLSPEELNEVTGGRPERFNFIGEGSPFPDYYRCKHYVEVASTDKKTAGPHCWYGDEDKGKLPACAICPAFNRVD